MLEPKPGPLSTAVLFNVSQLLKSDVGASRTYEFESDVRQDLDDAFATDIQGDVKFMLTNFGILATVTANAVLHLTCARCLEPCETPVAVTYDEEFQPTIDITSGKPNREVQREASSAISPNHTIDLSEALRENLVLAIDLMPLCRSDCRGLCPTCGTNHNVNDCTCPPVGGSNPFAVLETLLDGRHAES